MIKNIIAVKIPEFKIREIGLDFLIVVKSDAYNIPKTSAENTINSPMRANMKLSETGNTIR
jgi:hypothetical protein